jgi:hypothetical protein
MLRFWVCQASQKKVRDSQLVALRYEFVRVSNVPPQNKLRVSQLVILHFPPPITN